MLRDMPLDFRDMCSQCYYFHVYYGCEMTQFIQWMAEKTSLSSTRKTKITIPCCFFLPFHYKTWKLYFSCAFYNPLKSFSCVPFASKNFAIVLESRYENLIVERFADIKTIIVWDQIHFLYAKSCFCFTAPYYHIIFIAKTNSNDFLHYNIIYLLRLATVCSQKVLLISLSILYTYKMWKCISLHRRFENVKCYGIHLI